MKIGIRNNARWATLLVLAALALFAAGCGDDDKNSTETGVGATAGATGTESGGAAVEAGKIRDPKDVEAEKKNFSKEPPPVQILTGSTTGYKVNKPTVIVAKSTPEFRAMTKKHFSNGVKRDTIAPIDFKTRQAVGLFLPKEAEGAQVAITDIQEKDGKIVVTAIILLPGKGCKTSGGRLRPFHIVETRKMESKEVEINVKKQKTTAC